MKSAVSILNSIKQQVRGFEIPSVTKVSDRKDPYLVLISCILSLRTKDSTTIGAAERLFKLAHTPKKVVQLKPSQLSRLIYPVGFYRDKTRVILEISRRLIKEFDGRVPDNLEALLSLRGG